MPSTPPIILIAEDNSINIMLLKTMLRAIAPEAVILEARDGEAALDQLQSQIPDLIFMDIHMPLMDGLEATRAIRQNRNGASPKIIGLSAASSEEEKQTAFDSGMDDYLVKPVDKEALAQALFRHLN